MDMKRALLLVFSLSAGLCQTPAPSIGIVLTGGGSFGAFEAGAVKAYFDGWAKDHGGNPPPIRVIAGASTGALIGPFVALGPGGVDEVSKLYTSVSQGDILGVKLSGLLPFALFAKWSSSAYSAGPLRKKLEKMLPGDKVAQIGKRWTEPLRLVVLATGFGSGQPAPFTNSPEDIALGSARFRDGVLASAISPLATPPVYIKPRPGKAASPHLDGGIHAVTPFQAFFDLVARSPEIELTHVLVFSAYPPFPSSDTGAAQKKPYPGRPQFGDIGARMDALISESSISKEISLAWAAIELRNKGVSADKVRERTGLYIPKAPQELILYAPKTRLGWDNLKFDKSEMTEMFNRGRDATPRNLIP